MSIFEMPTESFGINAPPLPKDLIWLNSNPLNMNDLRNNVVLIDFWTYSCINCQRTLPYLKKWYEKYHDKGLIIIGVHTPEFEFEKDIKNVQAALKKYHVNWPVVLDNDYEIWDSYANHFWPAKYLVNKDSKIIYTHFGEGNYIESEIEIQKALKDAGYKVSDSMVGNLTQEAHQFGQTPEIYCGYQRGKLGNIEGVKQDKEHDYKISSSEEIKPDLIYLKGSWTVTSEYIEHSKETKDLDNQLVLSYRAKKVYLVMESAEGSPIKVYLTLDGVPLERNNAGEEVKFDSEERAYTEVQFATLYNLISTQTFGDHILRLSTLQKGLRCYAFTFGS